KPRRRAALRTGVAEDRVVADGGGNRGRLGAARPRRVAAVDGQAEWARIIATMSVRTHQTGLPRVRRASLPRARPRALRRSAGPTRRGTAQTRILAIGAVAFFALVLVHEATGLHGMQTDPVMGSDYVKIAQYVAARHKPGEPVFVSIPTQAYL